MPGRRCLVAIAGLLTVLLQAAFADPGPRGRAGRGGYRGPVRLLVLQEVQRELRLSDEQVGQVDELAEDLRQKASRIWEQIQQISPEEAERRFSAMRAEQTRRVTEILDERQQARLHQLEIQREGIRALARKEVGEALKLSVEQRQRVEAAFQGEHESMRSAFQDYRRGAAMSDSQREEARRRFKDVCAATDARLNAILSEAQRRQFAQMQGATFRFPSFERPLRP